MSLLIDGRIHRGECSFDLQEEIFPGEVVAVVGPNGSGKSTLLSVVSGLLRLADGSMSLDGRCLDSSVDDVYVAPEDRNVGMMFQSLHLVNQMTVIDNVALALRARGSSRNDARVVAQEHLDAVGAGHLAHRKASELSGGKLSEWPWRAPLRHGQQCCSWMSRYRPSMQSRRSHFEPSWMAFSGPTLGLLFWSLMT
jgi:ABC-type molybdate transport system ATPase subunit